MAVLTKDRQFYRTFFHLLIFVAAQNMLLYSVNLADTLMLGAYHQNSLAGAALANQTQFLLQMVINGIADGLLVLGTQYWGTKRINPIKRVVASAFRYGLPIVAVFFFTCLFFPSSILSLFTSDANVIAQGVVYLRILSFSFPLFFLTNLFIASQRCVENVSFGMWLSVITLTTNILLNLVLIFGLLGFPAMGIKGAAIATLISRIVEFFFALFYVLKKDKRLQMKLKDFFHIDALLHKDFFKIATPVVLSGASWGIAMSVQTAILGRLGSDAVSANAIATALFQVCTVISYGGASAAGIIIGKVVGQGDLVKTKEYTKSLQWIFLLLGALTFSFIQLLRGPIVSFYQQYGGGFTQQALTLSNSFINVLSVTSVGTAYQVACLTGIVRGGGNTKFVFFNDLIFMWGMVLPLALLGSFVFDWSPLVLFIVLKSDQITKCLVAVIYVNSYRWVRQLTREETTLSN
ncbi:MAG: MATE family efflux transporter [Clostridiales bacterium]|nr:MATE family efflux transporter [Clostridiales bacterium]